MTAWCFLLWSKFTESMLSKKQVRKNVYLVRWNLKISWCIKIQIQYFFSSDGTSAFWVYSWSNVTFGTVTGKQRFLKGCSIRGALMVLVSVFRVFVKWPDDFLMQVITPIFPNQGDAHSNKWMLLSYQPGRNEFFQWWGLFRSWCCRSWEECCCLKVTCHSSVSGFATLLGQIPQLAAAGCCTAQLPAPQPEAHACSSTPTWVSSWRKTAQRKQTNK